VTAALIDIYMPEMSGIETIKHLRMLHLASGLAWNTRLPIIALTVDERDAVREEALLAGADAFFTRPWQGEELLEALSRLIRTRNAAQFGNATIVDLREHPGFRMRGQTSVDPSVLEDLWGLGGEALVKDVAKSWMSDADVALSFMESMAELGDMAGFEARFMSILSSGAAVGATGLKPIRYLLRNLGNQSPLAIASIVIPRLRREAELVMPRLRFRCFDRRGESRACSARNAPSGVPFGTAMRTSMTGCRLWLHLSRVAPQARRRRVLARGSQVDQRQRDARAHFGHAPERGFDIRKFAPRPA
jgi:hypothetical protein